MPKKWSPWIHAATGALLAATCATASATLVTLNLHGTVAGPMSGDLSTGLPIGTQVTLSLTFNETFSDGSYDPADNLGPVSGSAQAGSLSFAFNGFKPNAYGYNSQAPQLVTWVSPLFTGTGPDINGGHFYGLLFSITPALTLLYDTLMLGYAFEVQPGVTSLAYSEIRVEQYTVTPVDPTRVPTPPTLPLVLSALAGFGLLRRRGAAAQQQLCLSRQARDDAHGT